MEQKNYNIRYLPSFEKELDEIIYYIAYKLKNKKAAKKLLDKINKAILDRSTRPESYEKYISKKNRKYTWHRIYIENYVVFYTVRNNTMEIVHLIYCKRNLDKLI